MADDTDEFGTAHGARLLALDIALRGLIDHASKADPDLRHRLTASMEAYLHGLPGHAAIEQEFARRARHSLASLMRPPGSTPTVSGRPPVRDATPADAAEMAALLNALIAKGGTTALEDPFTPDALTDAYIDGPEVHVCLVAIDPSSGGIAGFQALLHTASDPAGIGDIATFVRLDGAQRGVGTALFAETRARARALGLRAIDATIRADNAGGLAFYDRLGFVDHGVVPGVPLKDGTPIDRRTKRHTL